MIVVCTSCSARFRVADEKVGPRGAKLRCSKCQTVFTVQREIEVHFWGVILAACLFTFGIGCFIWTFIRYGLPVGELERGTVGDAPDLAQMRPVMA